MRSRIAFVVVALMVPAGAARADELVTFRWTAPPSCPTEAAVREMLGARVPKDTPVEADAVVTRAGDAYRLTLRIRTTAASGERVLEARDCKSIAGSAAVIVAMAATQAAQARAEAAPPPTPPTPASASPEQAAPPPATPAPPPSSEPARIVVRPELSVDVGTLPSAAFGGGVALGLDLPAALSSMRFEIYAGATPAQDRRITPSAGASFDLKWAGARGCFLGLRARPFQAGLCGGGELSGARGEAFGVARASALGSRVLVLRADATLSLSVTQTDWLAVRLGVGIGVPTARESFVIVPFGTVHERGAVSLRAVVGPELRF